MAHTIAKDILQLTISFLGVYQDLEEKATARRDPDVLAKVAQC